MNKASLIDHLAEKSQVTKKQANDMLENLVDLIIEELKADREVTITGFGTFLAKSRHARGGVNPQKPNERIQIPEVRVAKFKTGKTLKDALKGRIEQKSEPKAEEAPATAEETIE
jgi:nucleoid DNA-binding protein